MWIRSSHPTRDERSLVIGMALTGINISNDALHF